MHCERHQYYQAFCSDCCRVKRNSHGFFFPGDPGYCNRCHNRATYEPPWTGPKHTGRANCRILSFELDPIRGEIDGVIYDNDH